MFQRKKTPSRHPEKKFNQLLSTSSSESNFPIRTAYLYVTKKNFTTCFAAVSSFSVERKPVRIPSTTVFRTCTSSHFALRLVESSRMKELRIVNRILPYQLNQISNKIAMTATLISRALVRVVDPTVGDEIRSRSDFKWVVVHIAIVTANVWIMVDTFQALLKLLASLVKNIDWSAATGA